jgi:hypothetical protein
VIFRWKSFHKPGWQFVRHRTIQVKRLLLGNVMAHSVPVQCGFATDVESGDHTLQKSKGRVESGGLALPHKHSPCQAIQPASAYIMNGKIGRYA